MATSRKQENQPGVGLAVENFVGHPKITEPTKEMKKRQECDQTTLPEDVALKIVSCLEVSDVCSLGSCSRFWREICGSDYVWKSLIKERWPAITLDGKSLASQGESHVLDEQKEINLKGLRGFYIKKHTQMARKVASIMECLSCEQICINDYLEAIEDVNSLHFGFKDVQIFFLKPTTNVLLNLLGVHCCIKRLGVKIESVMEVISSCNIQERQVCVHWCRKGAWIHRFRMPEYRCRCVSLGYLTTTKGEEVLGVLDHGITHDVTRVHISTDIPEWILQPSE